MRADVRLSWAFLAAAGLEVSGLFLDRRLLPYGGSLAIVFLIGMALMRSPGNGRHPTRPPGHRWSRRLAVAGLAALAVAGTLISARTGAFVLPTAPTADLSRIELALLTASGAALAGAVLCRVERLVRKKYLLGLQFGLVYAPLLSFAAIASVVLPGATLPNLLLWAAVLAVPLAAVVLLVFAATAALISRGALRWVGAALLPVLALSMNVLLEAQDTATVNAFPDRDMSGQERVVSPDYRWGQSPPGFTGPGQAPPVFPPANRELTRFEDPREAVERAANDADRNTKKDAEDAAGIAAVPGPPGWSLDPWEGPIDWNRSVPAILAALLLLSLAAITTILFPRPVDAGD